MNSCCRSSPVTLEFEAIRRKDDRGVPPLTLLWNIEDIEYLRRHCRIPLSAIGQLNQGGHQRAKEGTLPCMIQPIEACLAIEYGFAIAVARTDRGTKKLEKETPREALLDILQCDRRSYLVYRDLWEQGFHLTSGLKFGGEFLAYEDDPAKVHAGYIVVILQGELRTLEVASKMRVAVATSKELILATVDEEDRVLYSVCKKCF